MASVIIHLAQCGIAWKLVYSSPHRHELQLSEHVYEMLPVGWGPETEIDDQVLTSYVTWNPKDWYKK